MNGPLVYCACKPFGYALIRVAYGRPIAPKAGEVHPVLYDTGGRERGDRRGGARPKLFRFCCSAAVPGGRPREKWLVLGRGSITWQEVVLGGLFVHR